MDYESFSAEVARRHALFESTVLPYAQALTPAELVPVAKRLAEKVAGVNFDARHKRAARERRVWVTDLEDGMSHLTAYLTSVESHAIFDRLTQLGQRLQAVDVAASGAREAAPTTAPNVAGRTHPQSGAPDPCEAPTIVSVRDAAAEAKKRPLPKARADSLVSLLLEGEISPDAEVKQLIGPRVSARVQVLVPVSLAGLLPSGITSRLGERKIANENAVRADDAPQPLTGLSFQPELAGVGPMDSDTAARIAHDSPSWDVVIVDDGTGGVDTFGDVLAVEGYRVPPRLRRFLAARDEHCRFHGCTLPVFRCDIDHTIAAEDGGPTATNNLGCLCRGHHTIKHHGGIQVIQKNQGEFAWTFPSGRRYLTRPPSKVTFSSALGSPGLQKGVTMRTLTMETRKVGPFGAGLEESSLNPANALGPGEPTPEGNSADPHAPPPF